MTPFHIQEIGPVDLGLYARVPARFLVRSVLRVEEMEQGLGGFKFLEEPVPEPYLKDYDTAGGDPGGWPARFDMSGWGLLLARGGGVLEEGDVVGGAAIAGGARPFPLDHCQRPDLAVLWDLRVAPEARGSGVARLLFQRACAWARARGFAQLGLETQNVNVPACRFYAKQGCRLGAVHRFGYAGVPAVAHEVMLLWYIDL